MPRADSPPLRVALVGMGRIGRVHLQALSAVKEAEVVGVYDLNTELARERAEAASVKRVFASWQELLKDPEVQCVGILLPHDLHEQYVSEALDAGKHVVCEKPLAPTLPECDRMLAAAARAGKKLLPVHNRVYSLGVEKMSELLRQDAIGEVFLAQTTGFEAPPTVQTWLATPRGGGGVLMSQAVHPMYVLRWLLGDVTRVSCLFGDRKVVDMTAEDHAVVLLKFANGVAGEMTCTFGIAHGPLDHSIAFHARDGYLELSRKGLQIIAPRMYSDTELHEIPLVETDSTFGFTHLWEDYSRGILNEAPTRQTAEDGMRAVEIVQAAYRSNATGQTINLPLETH
ncbi:MAG: Gfo/Idh/MocA family oxidoreductase [Chloroflexi bacterium]|nr:Gfo/Idh/MocA family oxidoreductase [Chloroflexota bacterium]